MHHTNHTNLICSKIWTIGNADPVFTNLQECRCFERSNVYLRSCLLIRSSLSSNLKYVIPLRNSLTAMSACVIVQHKTASSWLISWLCTRAISNGEEFSEWSLSNSVERYYSYLFIHYYMQVCNVCAGYSCTFVSNSCMLCALSVFWIIHLIDDMRNLTQVCVQPRSILHKHVWYLLY